MSYIQGYLAAVKPENKEAYRELARLVGEIFITHGATRYVESWGDDMIEGKVTDFNKAVKAQDDEVVVFSLAIFPDKQTYLNAKEKMDADERWADMPEECFDGSRAMWSGFQSLVDLSS